MNCLKSAGKKFKSWKVILKSWSEIPKRVLLLLEGREGREKLMWKAIRAIRMCGRETRRQEVISRSGGRRKAFGGLNYVKALAAVRPAFRLSLGVVVGAGAMAVMLSAVPEVATAAAVIQPQQSATANPVLLAAYLKACQLKALADENINRLEAEITRNRTAADKAGR